MERLEFSDSKYSAIEGAIHVNRYLLAKPFCKGKKVLDAACGEGYGSYLMSRWGADEVYGVDISNEAIANAKKNFGSENANFQCSSVEDMSHLFEENTFDVIISLETIEHLNNPEKFLSELKRLCKPDGIIIVSCPNDYYYYPTPELKNPYHVRKYTLNEFKELSKSILGDYSEIRFGTPINGFINVIEKSKYVDIGKLNQLNMLKYKSNVDAVLLQEDEEVNETNCSYFVGFWGELDNKLTETIAVYPRPMNSYPNYEKAECDWQACIDSLNTKTNSLEQERIKREADNALLEKKLESMNLKFEAIKAENQVLRELRVSSSCEDDVEKINKLENELNNIYNSSGYKFLLKWYGLRDRILRR